MTTSLHNRVDIAIDGSSFSLRCLDAYKLIGMKFDISCKLKNIFEVR